MAATAILALCMATSVVTIMMLQLAAVIVAAVAGEADTPDAQRFARAMILGVAYAAAFGGLGSLIGSPVNAAAAGLIARQTGERIDFAGWLVFGLPIAATAVLVTWGLLVAGTQRFALNLPDRGALLAFLGGGEPMQSAERRVLAVALITLAALAAVPLIKTWAPGASDAAVALVGALVLFLLPSGKVKSERLLTWTDAREAPWGVLIVIGGALALSAAMTDTGLAAWLASPLRGLAGVPPAIALLVLVAGAAVLTEFVNNFAAAAIIVPAAAATAAAVGADPVPFAIAVAIAAAGGFVVPGPPWLTLAVGTPPVRLPDLARTGVWLLPAAVLIETAICLMVGAARRG
jgi:sodium-dependent dicarboxylate transporter 2/3/5